MAGFDILQLLGPENSLWSLRVEGLQLVLESVRGKRIPLSDLSEWGLRIAPDEDPRWMIEHPRDPRDPPTMSADQLQALCEDADRRQAARDRVCQMAGNILGPVYSATLILAGATRLLTATMGIDVAEELPDSEAIGSEMVDLSLNLARELIRRSEEEDGEDEES